MAQDYVAAYTRSDAVLTWMGNGRTVKARERRPGEPKLASDVIATSARRSEQTTLLSEAVDQRFMTAMTRRM